jgi:hypothetical protein
MKIAKQRAKMWKLATSGENRKALLNLTQTRSLPRVTAETPENVDMGNIRQKYAA